MKIFLKTFINFLLFNKILFIKLILVLLKQKYERSNYLLYKVVRETVKKNEKIFLKFCPVVTNETKN